MEPALILIDGLPGSGKSTAADHLGDALVQDGRTVTVWQEMDPLHPLHVFKLDPMGAATAALPAWMAHDEFEDASITKWWEFMTQLEPDTVTIVESYPFQSAVRVLLQVGASIDAINKYWQTLLEALMTLRPALVIFKDDHPRDAFLRTAEARGDEWSEYVVRAVETSPLFRREGKTGVEAVADGLAEYQEHMIDLASAWPYPLIQLPARPDDYDRRDASILAFTNDYLRLL